jgi:hypothetical protein
MSNTNEQLAMSNGQRMPKKFHGEKPCLFTKGNTARAPKIVLLLERQTCFSKFSGRTSYLGVIFPLLFATCSLLICMTFSRILSF